MGIVSSESKGVPYFLFGFSACCHSAAAPLVHPHPHPHPLHQIRGWEHSSLLPSPLLHCNSVCCLFIFI